MLRRGQRDGDDYLVRTTGRSVRGQNNRSYLSPIQSTLRDSFNNNATTEVTDPYSTGQRLSTWQAKKSVKFDQLPSSGAPRITAGEAASERNEIPGPSLASQLLYKSLLRPQTRSVIVPNQQSVRGQQLEDQPSVVQPGTYSYWITKQQDSAVALIWQTLAAEDLVDSLIASFVAKEAAAVVREAVCALVWDYVESRPLTDLLQRLVDEIIYETALSTVSEESSVMTTVYGRSSLAKEEISTFAADIFIDALQQEYLLALLSAHDDECETSQSLLDDADECFADSLILEILLHEVIHMTDKQQQL